jgi:predicted GH43/DUF377 family glycosyl hydrolase
MDANEWAIAYTAYSRYGPIIALATTSDFQQADRLGTAMIPATKDAAIFPGKINGKVLRAPSLGRWRRGEYLLRINAPAPLRLDQSRLVDFRASDLQSEKCLIYWTW